MNAEPLLVSIVAALADARLEAVLIGNASKRAAARPRDLAVLEILEKTQREKEGPQKP